MSKSIISAILLSISFLATPVIASTDKPLVFTVQGMEFSLTQTKCTNKIILGLSEELGLRDELKDKFYAGVVNTVPMCWVSHPADPLHIFVIDELGNMGELMIPAKKPSGPST